MTRKDYEYIASIISSISVKSERIATANLFALGLDQRYKNFNKDKFILAARG